MASKLSKILRAISIAQKELELLRQSGIKAKSIDKIGDALDISHEVISQVGIPLSSSSASKGGTKVP